MYGDYSVDEEARLIAAGVDQDLESALRENEQQDYTVIDIKKVWAAVNDYDSEDYPNYAWVIEFTRPVGINGQIIALLQGWHDYSGWSCQSNAVTRFANSPQQAVGLLDNERFNHENFSKFQTELLKQVNSAKQETWYERTNKELGLK